MMRDNAAAHVADATTSRPRPVFTREMAKTITAPTLLTTGARSPAFFHEIIAALEECLPHTQRIAFDGSSHTVPAEDPDGFAAAVHGFIEAQRHR